MNTDRLVHPTTWAGVISTEVASLILYVSVSNAIDRDRRLTRKGPETRLATVKQCSRNQRLQRQNSETRDHSVDAWVEALRAKKACGPSAAEHFTSICGGAGKFTQSKMEICIHGL